LIPVGQVRSLVEGVLEGVHLEAICLRHGPLLAGVLEVRESLLTGRVHSQMLPPDVFGPEHRLAVVHQFAQGRIITDCVDAPGPSGDVP